MRRLLRLLMPLFVALTGLFAVSTAGTANPWQSGGTVLYSIPGYTAPPAVAPRKAKRSREARRLQADRHWTGQRTSRHYGQRAASRRAALHRGQIGYRAKAVHRSRVTSRFGKRPASRMESPVASVPSTAAIREHAAPQMNRPAVNAGRIEAHVDIRAQRMIVKVNGEVAHVWKVSTARQGFVTPRGVYGPQRMHKTYFSKKYYNSPMPYSIFFKGGYAVHGTNAVKALGGPASHGCIRLATGNARALFNLMKNHGPNRSRIIIT